MAVPFSRPCYNGGSNTNNNRRPRHRPYFNSRSEQQQQSQTTQQQPNGQNPHNHPVTRFLYGDGHINLANLSLTSRIAFYALYEAYRLLQDLTGNTNTTARVPNPQPRMPNPTAGPSNPTNLCRPDIVPREEERESTQSRRCFTSVKDDSTQFAYTQTGDVESSNSTPYSSPVKNYHQVNRVDQSPMRHYDQHQVTQTQDEVVSSNRINYPDMIPHQSLDQSESSSLGCKPFVSTSWSPYPDLIPSSPYNPDTSSSSYHGGDPDYDEEEEELDKGYDDVDGSDDVQMMGAGGVNWTKLGAQLCEIASAFETTFYEPVTEDQKAIYLAFQRIKMSSMWLNGRLRDNTLTGLAKTICRQVLLSSIWILLKKVL